MSFWHLIYVILCMKSDLRASLQILNIFEIPVHFFSAYNLSKKGSVHQNVNNMSQ